MKSKILALLGGTLLSGVAMAGGYQVNLAGQRQIGMGHTGTGLALDNASIFFNPGAMSHLRENGVTIGGSAIFSKIAYRALEPGNTEARTDNPAGTPFQVYGVYGITDKLKAGIGVYTPFGSTVKWGNEWSGRFGLEQLKLSAVYIQPTLSYKITEKLGVGAGLTYVLGSVNLQRSIPVQDQQGNYGHAELDGDATGVGYNVGVYFAPTEKISLGLSYRSQVDVNVEEGDATFTVPASLDARFPDTKFEATLPLPATLTLGIGIKPTDKLTLAIDVNRVEWSAYKSLRFDYEEPVSRPAPEGLVSENARNYEDSYIYRIGAEYKATDALALRAGAYYDSSPVQDGYLTPETPDADARGVSVGLGYNLSEKLSLDASFLYINKKERTDLSDKSGGIGGTYKAVAYIPGIGLNYKF
ncbi:OmpP1/FadL family transporter [Pontibacter vulgaris]|uniref:OmpP1/FadL family transporter n=1 Tax=Pontibacter vulgaris TaxID=2905679 RepID=UPI001FA7A1DB|nr:OmpP1/FadL family transporter [Pontibacter vulgaris]